jgi:hypothetical protein
MVTQQGETLRKDMVFGVGADISAESGTSRVSVISTLRLTAIKLGDRA